MECKTPEKVKGSRTKSPRADEWRSINLPMSFSLISSHTETQSLKIDSQRLKTTEKLFKIRAMSDFTETFPKDSVGAAQSEGKPAIINLLSDENE